MANGRGRLSGIQLLPDECQAVVTWAARELAAEDRTQTDIYQEFYARLDAIRSEHRGELEFTIPSFQAFNRHSLKLAAMTARLNTTRDICASLTESYDPKSSDDLTVIAAEAIKTLVFEIITAAGESGVDPKGAMNLANALRSAAQAQGVSTARRQKVEKEFGQQVDEAVDKVAKVKGLTSETVDAIKAQILGVPAA